LSQKGKEYPKYNIRVKANWIFYGNCVLQHVIREKIEGRIEAKGDKEEDVSSYWMTLRKLYTRYWKLENSLWKRLSNCRKTDYGMNVVHFKAKSPYKNTQKISSYLRENTLGLYYKDQPVNVVSDNNRSVL
jgi:hypothetical protein